MKKTIEINTINTEVSTISTEAETNNAQTSTNEKQPYDATEQITKDYDKIIDFFKKQMDSATGELELEYADMIEELEADKQEMLEGTIVGSPQYLKDEQFMHMFSISAGVVMSAVGTFLLIKARKVIGSSKAKIAGWILAGLGVGIVALHIIQMTL